MLSLINKLAWIISLSAGFIISFLIGIFIDAIDGGYAFDNDTFFIWVFFTLLFGSLTKKFFLSKKSIDEALHRTSDNIQRAIDGAQNQHLENIPPKQQKEKQQEETVPEMTLEEVQKAEEKYRIKNNIPRASVASTTANTKKTVVMTKKKSTKRKSPNIFEKFFSENLLAKIGGILLFLGVLFLLQLVYTKIGPVGKLLIGFSIGFILYGVGIFLDKKRLLRESRVLLGTGIIIIYLVILSGRYLIGDVFTHTMILSEGITFLLLICNTALSIITSLVYRSRILLQFSFVFAYFIPSLVGLKNQDTPYTFVGYSLIITTGAIILHALLETKQNLSNNLLPIAALGGNILILIAPFQTSFEWIIKLGALTIISLLTIFTAYKTGNRKTIYQYFLAAYVFIILLMRVGHMALDSDFSSGLIVIAYTSYLLLLLAFGVTVFLLTSTISIAYLLIFPLVIILGEILFGSLSPAFIPIILIASVSLYLLSFVFIVKHIHSILQYLFFAVLGLFIFFTSSFLNILSFNSISAQSMTYTQGLAIIITTFLFLISAFYFSSKKELGNLYGIGTIFSVIILLPAIERTGELMNLSIISIVGVVVLNLLVPFINKNLLKNDAKSIVLGLIAGVLFGTGEIYYFGEQYFPGVTLGLAFLSFAILYFILSYLMVSRLGTVMQKVRMNTDEKKSKNNIIYSLVGISISLFSLAIVFVFSKHSEIISAIWLFEATILFFLFRKLKEVKVYYAGIILLIIGLLKLSTLLGTIGKGEFLSLIPLSIILGSFFISLKFLDFEKREIRLAHDLGHIVGIGTIAFLLLNIIPNNHHGWSHFSISLLSVILAFFYSQVYSGVIKTVFMLGLVFFYIFHVLSLDFVFYKLAKSNLEHLKVLQYASTIFLTGSYFLIKKSLSKNEAMSLTYAFLLYLFIITTLFVYNFFHENVFVITLYWGLLALVFSRKGIQDNIIKYRTIGLYILTLTVGKILLYDVWYGLNDAVMRIIALMTIGTLMIFISILYSKKYGDNLKGEFNLQNLSDEKNVDTQKSIR